MRPAVRLLQSQPRVDAIDGERVRDNSYANCHKRQRLVYNPSTGAAEFPGCGRPSHPASCAHLSDIHDQVPDLALTQIIKSDLISYMESLGGAIADTTTGVFFRLRRFCVDRIGAAGSGAIR